MADLSGQSLGRYHLTERLGEGGMAVVYKAFDTRLDADVAVKVIRAERLAPEVLEKSLKRFEREAKALARLMHPNIVKVTDYGEFEGKPYLVMPFLAGGTLKERLSRPMAWRDALKIAVPIARALEYAHQRDIIHRDVKSSNILITDSGQPMISDFGVAKILSIEETVDLTGTGMGVGTPEYMAPEQWTGKTLPQSDQYALGVVLYEMVTGRKPYTAETPAAILLKQATEPLERPGKFAHDLPEKAERILLKSLARNPDDRYADMGVMAEALEAALSGKDEKKKAKTVFARREETSDTLRTVDQYNTQAERVAKGSTKKSSVKLDTPGNRRSTPPASGTKPAVPTWAIIGMAAFLLLMIWSWASSRTVQATPTPEKSISTATKPPIIPTLTKIPATPTPRLGIGSTMTGKDGMTLLYVPAGEFTMGSETGDDDEKPVHTVYVDAFWIDQTEVTNKMYSLCVEAGECNEPASARSYTHSSYYGNPEFDNYPVLNVDWNMAKTYCAWVDRRLPTEAEWEKAARGENAFTYPWGNAQPNNDLLNYGQYVGDTTEVGVYPDGASPYGALDMAGNVWEWVNHWYDAYPGNTISDSDYGTNFRVSRGGAWYSNNNLIRSAFRSRSSPASKGDDLGFRCASDGTTGLTTGIDQNATVISGTATQVLVAGSRLIECGYSGNGIYLAGTEVNYQNKTWNRFLYAFSGVAGNEVSIYMTSSGMDPYLILQGMDGKTLITDDSSGGGRNAMINKFLLPYSGVYYLVTMNNGQSGLFDLRLVCNS